MGLASYGIYTFAKSFVMMEENDLYKSYLVNTSVRVSKILNGVSAGAENHVSEIEANLSRPDRIGDIMQQVVAQNPYIRSCGLSFIADYYPQKGRWFCPYAYRDTTAKVRRQVLGSSRHDYLKADWFVEALKADSSYWSKPFFEHGDSVNPQVSYLVPIHNAQGVTVGILGVDLSLDWFSKRLVNGFNLLGDSIETSVDGSESTEDFARGYQAGLSRGWRIVSTSFIIDDGGTFLAHPDTSLVLRQNYFELAKTTKDTIDDYVGRQMVAGRKGMYCDLQGKPKSFDLFDDSGMSAYVYYAPVENTNWSLALAVPWLMIDGIGMALGVAMLLLIALAMLVVRIVGSIIIRQVTKPLRQLADSVNEVARGNFNAPLPKSRHNDEIRVLRDSFEDMQHSLTTYMEELRATTAEKASIENELKIAHDIQMSMLPKTFPPYPERSDIDIFGSLTPAKDVGGDLFDFYIMHSPERGDQLCFCIGDVSGKGVPASLVMATTRSLFRNISAHVSDPGQIVRVINEAQVEGNEAAMFVTLFVGILNLADGRLLYCNAGHNPPLLIGKQLSYLPCDPNLPAGLMPEIDFTVQEMVLQPGDIIFLYTDGLNEAEDAAQAQFGEERMEQVASRLMAEGTRSTKAVVERMTEAVKGFVGDAEQSDDLTMLAIEWRPLGCAYSDSRSEKSK